MRLSWLPGSFVLPPPSLPFSFWHRIENSASDRLGSPDDVCVVPPVSTEKPQPEKQTSLTSCQTGPWPPSIYRITCPQTSCDLKWLFEQTFLISIINNVKECFYIKPFNIWQLISQKHIWPSSRSSKEPEEFRKWTHTPSSGFTDSYSRVWASCPRRHDSMWTGWDVRFFNPFSSSLWPSFFFPLGFPPILRNTMSSIGSLRFLGVKGDSTATYKATEGREMKTESM